MNFSVKILIVLLLNTVLAACGGSGGKSDDGASLSTVIGTVSSQTGGSSELSGWALVLLDAATGEVRVSEIEDTGYFSLANVDASKEYTLAMVNIEYRLTALLTAASDSDDKVLQYFKIKDPDLSRIVFKGQNLTFGDASRVEFLNYTAADSDGDLIPDGLDSGDSLAAQDGLSANQLPIFPSFTLAGNDIDSDEILNGADFDIDADGLPNWLDDDDDSDGILDIFDTDANDNTVDDLNETIGNSNFSMGIDYFVAQVFYKSGGELNLRFSVKVSKGYPIPTGITILGSESFFDDAKRVNIDGNGQEHVGGTWDFAINDDGSSFDDGVNDGLYSSKVRIKSGKSLKTRQVFFARLTYGNTYRDFPFSFPSISTDSVEFSYDSDTRRVTLGGNPFGEDQEDYFWSVSVYSSEDKLVHISSQLESSRTRYTIPEEELSDDEDYTAKVFAQSLEKIPGFPVYVIESEQGDLQ